MNEAGLVDIQAAVEADAPEVRPPVWNPRRKAFGRAGLFNAGLGRRGHGAASTERLSAILHQRFDGAAPAFMDYGCVRALCWATAQTLA